MVVVIRMALAQDFWVEILIDPGILFQHSFVSVRLMFRLWEILRDISEGLLSDLIKDKCDFLAVHDF